MQPEKIAAQDRLIVPLDVPSPEAAEAMVKRLGDIPFHEPRRSGPGTEVHPSHFFSEQVRLAIVRHGHRPRRPEREHMHSVLAVPQHLQEQLQALLLKSRRVTHFVGGRLHHCERRGGARDVPVKDIVQLQYGDESRLARAAFIRSQTWTGVDCLRLAERRTAVKNYSAQIQLSQAAREGARARPEDPAAPRRHGGGRRERRPVPGRVAVRHRRAAARGRRAAPVGEAVGSARRRPEPRRQPPRGAQPHQV